MINQYGFSLGVVGMSNIDAMNTTENISIGDLDLTKEYEGPATKKVTHNLKRVLKNSSARSIAAAGFVVFLVGGTAVYTLSGDSIEAKQGRDLQALNTVSLNYSETGRDQLTQEQVEHIQRQTEQRAKEAAANSQSYTPEFSDVVTASVDNTAMTDDLQPAQVTFDGAVKGSNYVESSAVKNASFANTMDYSSPKAGDGAINYAGGVGSAMPVPAAVRAQQPQPMQQGQGSENATYATNDGSGGGAGGGANGDGGMGAGGPNATGIDPSVEALRQSLEDDYNNQQVIDQQYASQQQQIQQQQQQQLQQQIQQRQQATQQAFQQQQQAISQQNNNMGFTAATYIPKQTSSNAASNVWNNDLSSVASAASVNGQATPQADPNAKEEVKNLASHIVRVGTTWNVVVENSVNTDNGTTVFARALSGPYAGARLVGTINSQGVSGRSAGVVFETLIPERRNKNAIPIKAVGMTLGNLDTHVATSVNRHYLQRYAALIAQGITGGYAEAYSDTSGSVSQIVNSDGSITTVSTNEKPDSEEIRGQVIGQLGTELQGEFQTVRARPTTYVIEQGTPLTIMFVQNMDSKTASVDSINVGSVYSNTSSYGMQPRSN